ncbi:hypothetical protein EAF00_008597 [Botryotinia globosa]|nr:hypothetical protein EAF00_008597 [Botryotinia globosa]
MDNEYIKTFRWLRDDYTRLRDGTELFGRMNERYSNVNRDDPGSSVAQQDPSSLGSGDHDWSINAESAGSCGHNSSVDSITISQGFSKGWSSNDTKQNEPCRPRKGNKKSRRGCYSCKKRKVKCQETLPSCQNCARNQLSCSYPTLPPPKLPVKPHQIAIASPVAHGNLQATPTIFSSDDMFIFHHFLMYAHPYLPVGSKDKWVCHIPAPGSSSYFRFVQIYLAISKMSNRTFSAFIGETNQVARVLIAHFLAVQKIMGPILCREAEISNPGSLNSGLEVGGEIRGHEKWVEEIWSQLTRDGEVKWKESMEWPREVFRSENSNNLEDSQGS